MAGNDVVFLRASLEAYAVVSKAWPGLHPSAAVQKAWATMNETALVKETARVVADTDAHGKVRLFWKKLPGYTYAGVNKAFADDSGYGPPEQLVGKDDFTPGVSWARQAAGYRRYDEEVVRTCKPNLDILERQDQPSGTVFVHTSKAPIMGPDGRALGILGMYEVLDAASGARLLRQRGGG